MPASTLPARRLALGCCAALALGCSGRTVVSLLAEPPLSVPDAAGGSAGTGGAGASGASGTSNSGGSGAGGASGTSGSSGSAGIDAGASGGQLIHRYDFSGTGTIAVDSIGGADGIILGTATLDGAGHLPLDGNLENYVTLPSGMIHTLTSATIVAWLDWGGGGCWQRLFVFGNTDAGKDLKGNAITELYFSPLRCPGSGPTLYFSTPGASDAVDSNMPFPAPGRFVPITAVLDGINGQMAVFVDGIPLGTNRLPPLAIINDETAWFGRSLWTQDINLRGIYDELRIYDYAFTEPDRLAVEAAGPDTVLVP